MLVFKYEISRVSTGLLFRAFGGRWKCTAHLDQDVFLFKPLHAIKAFPLAFFQYWASFAGLWLRQPKVKVN